MSDSEDDRLDASGRVLGPRALATRQRMLDETRALLETTPLGDLRVAQIARRAGTAPATFYQYFKDAEAAVLCIVEQATAEMPAIVAMIDGDWRGEVGLERARRIANAFVQHWDDHGTLLRRRNAASDEGNVAFQKIRNTTMAPVILELTKAIEKHRPGIADTGESAVASAAALAAVFERLAAYHGPLEILGAERAPLIETIARIAQRTVSGEA